MLHKIHHLNVTIGLIACIIGLAVSSGCAKPPTKEMADAEAAVTAAKLAEADVYVPSEYKSAEDMLSHAKEDMQKKEYNTAKDSAIKTIALADMARNHAVSGKEKAKKDADAIISELKTAIDDADRAGAKRFYANEFKELNDTLGEIKTAYQAGKYLEVISKGQSALAGARKLTDMAKRATDEESRRLAEDAARRRAEEDARLKAEESRRKAEEEARRAEDARRAEEARLAADEEAKRNTGRPETYKVVRGDCLWNISKKDKIYGDPFMWPMIYKENRSQIHDPDLIFPKQNFKIPRDYTQKDVKDAVYMAKHRGPEYTTKLAKHSETKPPLQARN